MYLIIYVYFRTHNVNRGACDTIIWIETESMSDSEGLFSDDENDTESSSSSVSTALDALEDLDLYLPKTQTFTFSKYSFKEIDHCKRKTSEILKQFL